MFYDDFIKFIADNGLDVDDIKTVSVFENNRLSYENMDRLDIYDTPYGYIHNLFKSIDDKIKLNWIKNIDELKILVTFKDFITIYMYMDKGEVVISYI